VESMKKKGPSVINENLSVGTSAGVVAEEVFNDMKRSRTGGFKQVDESKYGVKVRRLLAENTEAWTGEVVGPPAFFSQKTVDILVAGKTAFIFNKQNKKLAEAKLTFGLDEAFLEGGVAHPPCVEDSGMLYLFDQGILTAFELPSCEVRWRLPSVGITKVLPDGRGGLYVDTTSASPDDIKYSDDIKITDPTMQIVIKVDAKGGKKLWTMAHMTDCRLSGKFLYSMNTPMRSGPGLAVGLSEALGMMSSSPAALKIFRLNPSNGKVEWDYFSREIPDEVDFCGNRILMLDGQNLKALKFFSLF
jgi:hypothetical protein